LQHNRLPYIAPERSITNEKSGLAAPVSHGNLQFLQYLCFAMKRYLAPNARIIPAISELTIKRYS
jgi:hypothetical protein